jgi:hypothetical protein
MWNLNLEVFLTVQTSAFSMSTLVCAHCFPGGKKHPEENMEKGIPDDLELGNKEIQNMFGIIAAVLIVLWLLGFFAFHVTTGFIHIVLLVGLVLLVFHLLRGRSAVA